MTAGRIIGPQDGEKGTIGGIGVRYILAGAETGGRFTLVEHPMPPRSLAGPLHRHLDEDEYGFVLRGHVGALLGDEVLTAGPGDFLVKPRGQWHTFWNAGDEEASVLEIISPAGFEQFFRDMAALWRGRTPEPAELRALSERYRLEADPASVPRLVERFGLVMPG